MRHATKCQLSYIQQYLTNTYGAPKSQYYCPNVKRARNGEPIKTGTDGILNFDQSKMLFPPGHVSFVVYRNNNIYQNK